MKDDLLFGIHPVAEWLDADPARIEALLVAPNPNDRVRKLVDRARRENIPIETLAMRDLRQLAGPRNPQGIGARVASFPFADLEAVLSGLGERPLLLGVDGVTDPGNLGAILRSASFFGVDAVVLPRDKSASITPVTEKAAAGAAARIPICQVNNLRTTVLDLQQSGFQVVASIVGPHPAPAELDLTGPVLLLLGSEGKGLRPSLRKACDAKTSLPSAGPASLNVSAFASVLLYEAHRQRTTVRSPMKSGA